MQVLREVKSNPYEILKTFIEDSKKHIGLKSDEIVTIKLTELSILDRYSTGSQISKKALNDAFVLSTLVRIPTEQEKIIEDPEIIKVIEEEKPKKEKISLQEIDDRLMTIDDFLK